MRRLMRDDHRLADQAVAALLPVVDDVGGDEVEALLGPDDRLEPGPARSCARSRFASLTSGLGDLCEPRRRRSARASSGSATLARRDS